MPDIAIDQERVEVRDPGVKMMFRATLEPMGRYVRREGDSNPRDP